MRTVFILGAGASQPYGFPSGYKLVSDIVDVLGIRKQDFENWGVESSLRSFRQAIQDSQPPAIDDLIIQRPKEFLQIGKLAIAAALTQYEIRENLTRREIEDDWYSHFFNHVRSLPQPLSEQEFSFITFNYDRSLETCLDSASEGAFGNTSPGKKEAIKKIPILHVHGHLGFLPSGGGNSPYEPAKDRGTISSMATNLKLTAEEGDGLVLGNAQSLIQKADRIRFLGFGFHESNMKKLDFNAITEGKHDVSGTALGKTAVELKKLAKDYPKLRGLDNHQRKIVQFFREAKPLD
jgi:hypothetical protein